MSPDVVLTGVLLLDMSNYSREDRNKLVAYTPYSRLVYLLIHYSV